MADEPNLPDGWGKLNDGPLIDPRLELVRENANLRAEIAKLRAALGTVTRMKVMPDDKVNRITLVAAIAMANRALSDEQQRESGS